MAALIMTKWMTRTSSTCVYKRSRLRLSWKKVNHWTDATRVYSFREVKEASGCKSSPISICRRSRRPWSERWTRRIPWYLNKAWPCQSSSYLVFSQPSPSSTLNLQPTRSIVSWLDLKMRWRVWTRGTLIQWSLLTPCRGQMSLPWQCTKWWWICLKIKLSQANPIHFASILTN